jgi:hypothetical protein
MEVSNSAPGLLALREERYAEELLLRQWLLSLFIQFSDEWSCKRDGGLGGSVSGLE